MGSWEFHATSAGWVARLDGAERAAVLDVVDDVVELLAADEASGAQVSFGAGGAFDPDAPDDPDAPVELPDKPLI